MKRSTHDIPFAPARWPFFYGWFVLLCSGMGLVMTAPGQTAGVGPFVEPLLGALDITRDQSSLAYMIGTLCSGALVAFAGRAYDLWGARVVAAVSAAGLGAVLLFMTRIEGVVAAAHGLVPNMDRAALTVVLLSVGFFGMRFTGQGALSLASGNMAMKWFERRRGLANGLRSVLVAVSMAGTPPLFKWMIGRMGWQNTWLLLAALVGGGWTVFVLVFYRDNPHACGLDPDGMAPPDENEEQEVPRARDFTLGQTLRTPQFWAFMLSLFMAGLYVTALYFHLESLFTEAGRDGRAAFGIPLRITVIAVPLALVAGAASDRMNLKHVLMGMQLGLVVSLAGLASLQRPGAVWLVVAGNGVAMGLWQVLGAVTWPRFYGLAHLGAISGIAMAMMVMGSAVGPYLFSRSLTATGSYAPACLFCAVVIGVLGFYSPWCENPQDRLQPAE